MEQDTRCHPLASVYVQVCVSARAHACVPTHPHTSSQTLLEATDIPYFRSTLIIAKLSLVLLS